MKSKKKKTKKTEWYELISYFDPDEIKPVPVEGRVFLMGAVNDIPIVEVARDTPEDKLESLAQWLEEAGIEALVVTEGVKFLRLRPAKPAECAVLEEHMEGVRNADASPGG